MLRRAILVGTLAVLGAAGAARAGTSGVGIPETGGQGAGAASADARGLASNPAAAAGAKGSELALDAALMVLDVHYQRAPYRGSDPTTDPDRTFPGADSLNAAVVPYAGFRTAAPFRPASGGDSKVGLGVSISVPFGRNVHFSPDHPGRYHVVTADFSTIYLTPAFAIRPIPALRFGFGPVLGVTQLRLRQRLDLAPTLQELAPGDPPPPPESGLLEGEIFVRHAQGASFGVAGGAIVELGEPLTIGLGVISGQRSTVHGRSRVVPSRDLTLYTTGDFALTQNLPPIVNLGGRFRLRAPWELSLEAQWVGWSVNRYFHLEIENSEVASSNADLQDLLDFLAAQGFDLNAGKVVENVFDKDQYIARGYRDSWNVLGGAEYRWAPEVTSRFQLGFDKAAIPDRNVNVGNVDFDNVILGAGVRWSPAGRGYSLGVSYTQYIALSRDVEGSSFATHGTPVEYAFPSGDGAYSAVLSRFAVDASYRF